MSFIVLALIFRSLVHFKLILLHVDARLSASFVDKTILFPLNDLSSLAESQLLLPCQIRTIAEHPFLLIPGWDRDLLLS
jgi:hypothetical protein